MRRITLVNTDCYSGLTYADVKDFCLNNEIEIPEEGTHDEYEIRSKMSDMDIEDFWDNLKCCTLADKPCVVTGTLGLWNGHPDIEPKTFKTLVDAVRACVENMIDYKIEQNHSTIEVTGYHHDGTNTFEIHMLNLKGCYAVWEGREAKFESRYYRRTLKDYIF